VTYARDHVFERSAVEDRRDILEAALNRGMGQTTVAQVGREFERRLQTGEFVAVEHVGAGQQYTTATMLRMEREIIGHMQEGNGRSHDNPVLVPAHIRVEATDRHPTLNAGQRHAVEDIFLAREKLLVWMDAWAPSATAIPTNGTIHGFIVIDPQILVIVVLGAKGSEVSVLVHLEANGSGNRALAGTTGG
jgi:hypothetical protein